ncbi:hypothetical protein BDV93DRAFT_559282 [Ceratobasidium sp. AG-I]|nr:hypothetical protein BDV93DRAFT_559282 [Ceratobasidium sp. AG-I]
MSKKSSASTAWSHEKPRPRGGGASSLTSDLLAPRRPSPQPPQKKPKESKPQSSAAASELLKSHEVKRLEKLIDEVSTGVVDSRSANRPGCFCMAKSHPLSTYVPLCIHCGIILCSLHNPALPCPSCSSPLLPPATRNALLTQLQEELAVQLSKEAEKRAEEMRKIREAELARSGGGHFPTLNGQPDNKPVQAAPRKVLSLNSTTKKATLSTFIAVPTPPASNPASGRASPVEDRVPAPGQMPAFVELDPELKLLLRQRPWVDLKDPTPMYIPEPLEAQPAGDQQSGGGRGRGRGKRGRGGGQNLGFNDRVVPGAGPSQ